MADKKHKLLLLVPPLLLFLITMLLSQIRGPFYVYNPDPSYEYLLTSLQLLKSGSAGYTGHPGTTLQLLGVPAIGIGSLFFQKDAIALDVSVLANPEPYLNTIYYFQIIAVCACMALCGIALSKRRGIGIALLFQTCFLVLEAPLTVLTNVSPESIIICVGFLLIPLLQKDLEFDSRKLAGRDLLTGILLGCGAASKLNFLPLWFLAFIPCGWKRRITILITAVVSFIAFTLPVFSHYREIWDKMVLILVHGGRFSQGSLTSTDFAALMATAGRLFASQTFFFLLFLILLVVYVSRIFICRTWRPEEKRAFSLGLLIVFLLIVATIRYPGNRYLIPAMFPLIWLHTFLFEDFMRKLKSRFSGWANLHSVLTAALILVAAGSVTVSGFVKWSKATRAHLMHTRELSNFSSTQDCMLIPYYRASLPEFALAFGNHYADGHFGVQLNRLYPNTIFYDLFHQNFYSFRKLIDDQSILDLLEEGHCIHIRGLSWESQLKKKLIIEDVVPGREAIYQLKDVKLSQTP